jgi:hypothetical protein
MTVNELGSLQGKLIMSITFGYDLKKGDRMVEASDEITKLMTPFAVPGTALVNYFPFCTLSNFIPAVLVVPNGYLQCGAFLHGSHTSATNHWRKWLGSWVRG